MFKKLLMDFSQYKNICSWAKVSRFFLLFGAFNWGLIGFSILFFGRSFNLVYFFFSGIPIIEAFVYLFIGLAFVYEILVPYTKKCDNCLLCKKGTITM